MNLSILILVPLITAVAVLLMRNNQMVKWTAFAGSLAQIALTGVLMAAVYSERANGNTAPILFEQQYNWFPALNISLHFGVDGISIAMILLTSLVVVAGVLVSWKVEKMTIQY